MKKELIFIGSITRTMRARDILRRNGINVKIERSPSDYSNHGCGYGIIVAGGDIDAVYRILNSHNFSIKRER